MRGQLAAADKAHLEIQTDISLETFIDVHDEWMLDLVCDIFLLNHLFDFVIIKDFIFSHALHGVVFVCLFIFDKEDFAKATLSNNLYHFVILQALRTQTIATNI